jgi:hypothetical protein
VKIQAFNKHPEEVCGVRKIEYAGKCLAAPLQYQKNMYRKYETLYAGLKKHIMPLKQINIYFFRKGKHEFYYV